MSISVDDLDKFVRIEKAAAILGESVATIRRRVTKGELHPRRVLGMVLFVRADVESLRVSLGRPVVPGFGE